MSCKTILRGKDYKRTIVKDQAEANLFRATVDDIGKHTIFGRNFNLRQNLISSKEKHITDKHILQMYV